MVYERVRKVMRERRLWLLKGIGGLVTVSFGLCVFGEALARRIAGDGWFGWGTIALIVFNFGLCLMFDSANHQRRWEARASTPHSPHS